MDSLSDLLVLQIIDTFSDSVMSVCLKKVKLLEEVLMALFEHLICELAGKFSSVQLFLLLLQTRIPAN